jgi:adenylyltransferase/sulfurtransferase
MLTPAQVERYSRHILLPEIGGLGQERLLASRAVVAGEGPVADACLAYLAAAGVGAVDWLAAEDLRFDEPMLLLENAMGDTRRRPSMAAALAGLNPDVAFGAQRSDRPLAVVEVAPCAPTIAGSRIRAASQDGRAAVARGACADCLRWATDPDPSSTRGSVPALAAAAAVTAGALAATEAIHFLLGRAGLDGHALWVDLGLGKPQRLPLPGCPLCARGGS